VKNKYNTLQENTDKLCNQNVRKQPNGNNHNKNHIQFHPRVESLTNIGFNNNILLLSTKGLQHNLLNDNKKQWLEQLVIDTETTITKLPIQEQDGYRHLAKYNIEKITIGMSKCNKHNDQDLVNIKSIRHKIRQHDPVITKADKGKIIVITTKKKIQKKTNFHQ
jgi:hypothetical protein